MRRRAVIVGCYRNGRRLSLRVIFSAELSCGCHVSHKVVTADANGNKTIHRYCFRSLLGAWDRKN